MNTKFFRSLIAGILAFACMSASAQFAGIGGGLYGFNTTGSGSAVVLNSGAPSFVGAGPILFSNGTDNNVLNWLGPTGSNNSYLGITFTNNWIGDAAAGDMFLASDGKAIRFSAGVSRASTQLKVDSTGATVTGVVAASGLVTSRARNVVEILCNSSVSVSAPADTSEDTLYTCSIPANAIGPNGAIRWNININYTSNANTKTVRVRYSGASGTIIETLALSASPPVTYSGITSNRNATNSQISSVTYMNQGGALSLGNVTSAIDTTAITSLVITCQKAVAGDACTSERVLVELLYAP